MALEKEYLSTLPPNRPRCHKCGYEFIVSQKIIRRPCICPKCHYVYTYERELGGKYKFTNVGAFRRPAELEFLQNAKAKSDIIANPSD